MSMNRVVGAPPLLGAACRKPHLLLGQLDFQRGGQILGPKERALEEIPPIAAGRAEPARGEKERGRHPGSRQRGAAVARLSV
jgi:hypothetical protein